MHSPSGLKPFRTRPKNVPSEWKQACAYTECTLHQLSPFIGKLKSSIACDLIMRYSKPGDLIADPFAGSGTIPLEAVLAGRRTFSADINPYAKALCEAKLDAPLSCEHALDSAERALDRANRLPDPDLRTIPVWVRQFFHGQTLKEALKFAEVCRKYGESFLLGCFLGILHHQRPGFLSFPSSHLVPYLRKKKYPPNLYPEMYEYRALRPRLLDKIGRAYARPPSALVNGDWTYRHCSIQNLKFPHAVDCVITSPPYMNALDYNRDNRLRLWFIHPDFVSPAAEVTSRKDVFLKAVTSLAKKVDYSLKSKGFCVLIVGERVARSPGTSLSQVAYNIMVKYAPRLRLVHVFEDDIPDIRRSRRDCRGTKKEHFLIFKRK